jgi:CheY-like chemotaxis protein
MKNVKILLIDDSAALLQHISLLLKAPERTIFKASNLAQALQEFEKQKPDAVICDFILEAGSTGLEVISAIYAVCANLNQPKPPATLLTLGKISDVDQERAKSLNIPVTQKPIRGQEEEFTQEIDYWLRSKVSKS